MQAFLLRSLSHDAISICGAPGKQSGNDWRLCQSFPPTGRREPCLLVRSSPRVSVCAAPQTKKEGSWFTLRSSAPTTMTGGQTSVPQKKQGNPKPVFGGCNPTLSQMPFPVQRGSASSDCDRTFRSRFSHIYKNSQTACTVYEIGSRRYPPAKLWKTHISWRA